jgi:hypothetical protein
MKPMTRSISASLGSFSSTCGLAPDPSALSPPGSGTPRAIISRLSVAFSPCSRAISLSSTVRSSGTAWHAQPAVRLPHSETLPVRVSSRRKPSWTWLKVKRPFSLSGAMTWA